MRLKYPVLLFVFLTFGFTNVSLPQDTSSVNQYDGRVRVVNTDPDNPDVKLFRSVNNCRTKFFDNTLPYTDKSVFAAAIILPSAMFIYGRAADKSYEENTAVLLALSEATNLLLNLGIKNIVKRPRPYQSLSHVYYKNVSIKDEYSFPSSHTSTSFSIAATFALRYSKYPQIYVPMYLWGLVVGYGRMYFGMHYPSDVLGGAVLGSLSAIAVYSLRSEIIKAKNKVFGEENRPDANQLNSKTAGIIGTAYVLSFITYEFFDKSSKFYAEFLPFTNQGASGINFTAKFDF
jgi:membrane-associated phospholipid phosphatase